jgi:lactoylglutathione lyase
VTEPALKPWGQTTGYLRDPDGFIVEVCTRSPRD